MLNGGWALTQNHVLLSSVMNRLKIKILLQQLMTGFHAPSSQQLPQGQPEQLE